MPPAAVSDYYSTNLSLTHHPVQAEFHVRLRPHLRRSIGTLVADAPQSQQTGTDDDELYVSNPTRVAGITLHAGLTLWPQSSVRAALT